MPQGVWVRVPSGVPRQCDCGEIGRHKRLKIPRPRVYRFDSGQSHQVYGVTLADLVEVQTHKSKVQFLQALPFLQTMIRAGVIPLEALCSDAHLLWTSCTGERPVNVPGVKSYLLSIVHVHTPRRNRIVCSFYC